MLSFYPVRINHDLDRQHPLYVGNFFKLERMWWRTRKKRQNLILSIAVGWYYLVKRNAGIPEGFIEQEIFITNLTRQLGDAKIILERFFEIKRLGFNFGDGLKSPTLINPKRLSIDLIHAIENILDGKECEFDPGNPPTNKKIVTSTVKICRQNIEHIKNKLQSENKEYLLPQVNWLISQEGEITFYYERAGKLQSRDKSVWPIKSIETWPGWLRTDLFGTSVDIENSYVQFLLHLLTPKHIEKPGQLSLKYPDLIRAHYNKKDFRKELCELLKLEHTPENVKIVKKLIMSLANGSNASPGLMMNGSGRSEAVKIVIESNPNLLPSDLIVIGKRLSTITKQFKAAKRELCFMLLNSKPSRKNQKQIFSKYLEWERESRYKLWKMTNMTGLGTHDGLDGIIVDDPSMFEDRVFKTTGLRVKISA